MDGKNKFRGLLLKLLFKFTPPVAERVLWHYNYGSEAVFYHAEDCRSCAAVECCRCRRRAIERFSF